MKGMTMKMLKVLLCMMLLAGAQSPAFSQEAAQKAGAKNDYSVGDRLKQGKATGSAKAFREITWEELVPKDWDPEKLFKDLDFDTLEDSDPRAMEVLERMRKEWNEAPVE